MNMINQSFFIQQCRQHKLKVTAQRITIYQVITALRTHPTVEEVWSHAKREMSTLSLDSVYRILGSLNDMGLVRRLDVGAAVRYDGNPETHSHFICTECEKIVDVLHSPISCDQIQMPQEIYSVNGMEIVFKGRCATCAYNDVKSADADSNVTRITKETSHD